MAESQAVVRYDPARFQQVTTSLAQAFLQDAWKIQFAPNPHHRQRLLHWLMGGVVRYCQAYGEVYIAPDGGGAACWLPPGRTHLHGWGTLRAWGLFPPSVLVMDWRGSLLSMRVQAYTEAQHKRLVPGPHWYLFLLGVSPERQGQGLGGRLIQPVLARADQAGLPCYLETQTAENVAFYERRGFQVLHQAILPGLDLPIWFMSREPRE